MPGAVVPGAALPGPESEGSVYKAPHPGHHHPLPVSRSLVA